MKGSDKFETVRTYDPIAKKHRQYQTAHCYKCGAFENLPVTGTSALPPPPLIKQLQHRGWVMGTSRKHDMCPDCVKEAAEARRKAKSTGTVVDFHPQPPITTTIPMNSPPETKPLAETVTTTRHPTREDKRLIILEIENHYLGADKGYTTGASDETVAKSLNVPLKWVADLREEFFGPVVNPEIAKLSADIAALVTRMDNHEREGRDIRAKAMEMKGAGRPRWSALMLLTLPDGATAQIAEAGGDRTLKGRELALSHHMQAWIAREVELGTDVELALRSFIFAMAVNVAGAAQNLAHHCGGRPAWHAQTLFDYLGAKVGEVLEHGPLETIHTTSLATKQ